MQDGTYAVQADAGDGVPLTISGFKTAEEALAWIEFGQGRNPKGSG